MESLTSKQKRHLRGLGHHLKPIVMVGKDQISDRLLATVDEALTVHELIKVKLQEGCDLPRTEVAQMLSAQSASEVVQILGKTILLFRRSEKKLIEIP